MDKKAILKSMRDKWTSGIVARTEIDKFTGGLYSPKYMANLDSNDQGPSVRIKVRNTVAYPIDSLLEWIGSRSVVENVENSKVVDGSY